MLQSGITSSSNVLLVGASGFIASSLLRHLDALGCKLSIIVNHQHSTPLDPLPVDLLDHVQCSQLSAFPFTHVFNCSGAISHSLYFKGGKAAFDQHFTLVKNLVDHLNWDSIESFIQIGSSDEYGSQPAPQEECMREEAISPYSAGKSLATHFLQMLARTEHLPIQIIRPFLVYGPGQKSNRFLPYVIESCLNDQFFEIGPGDQIRDFLYVDDLVDAMLKCATYNESYGEVFNIASGQGIQLKGMIQLVQEKIGKGHPVYGARSYRQGENMSLVADISKAKEMLNWQPVTMIDEGLDKTIAWYKGHLSNQYEVQEA